MRKVENGEVMTYNEIAARYKDEYSVVETISEKPEIGEYLGKVLWLCDNYDEAICLAYSLDNVEAMAMPGMDCYSVLGGAFK